MSYISYIKCWNYIIGIEQLESIFIKHSNISILSFIKTSFATKDDLYNKMKLSVLGKKISKSQLTVIIDNKYELDSLIDMYNNQVNKLKEIYDIIEEYQEYIYSKIYHHKEKILHM